MDNNTTQNSSGMMNGMPPMAKPERKIGPMVGALIIVLVLIIAALYFFGQRMYTSSPAEIQQQQSVTESVPAQPAAAVIPADDIDTLQADLSASFKDVDYSF